MVAVVRLASLIAALGVTTATIDGDGRQARPRAVDPQTASISGRVVDGGTGRPVNGAVVTLTPPQEPWPFPRRELPPRVSAMTRADGRFTFRSVKAGAHRVEAEKPGYLAGAHGRPRPSGSSRPVEIEPAERADITITLWKQAAITGMVVDEAGEPVVGQEMRALQRVFAGGRSHLRISGANLTDDRGVYRIGQLEPGAYFVVPSITQTFGSPEGRSDRPVTIQIGSTRYTINEYAPAPPVLPGSDRLMFYPALFYPGVQTVAQAPPINLGSGEERANVDFQLLPSLAARVSGRALEAPPGAHVALELVPAGLDDLIESVVAETLSDGNGVFAFPAIPPGDYVLRARSSAGTDNRWAVVGLSVGQQDVTGVDFVMRPSLRINGRVEFVGTAQGGIRDVHVVAEAADGTHVNVAPQRVAPTGRFTIDGLPGGHYVLRVSGIASGWMLQSVSYEGRDVADVPLALASDASDVVIAITNRVTDLGGTVRTTAGAPDRDALVVVFPADGDAARDAGSTPRRVRSVRTNESGTFRIVGLPAGDYSIVAIPDEEMGDGSPAMFVELARGADAVRLDEGVKKEVQLHTRVRSRR